MRESVPPEESHGDSAVLLITADTERQASYRSEFEDRGVRLRICTSFRDGMSGLSANPALILVEHDLPDGTGTNFAREARRKGYAGLLLLIPGAANATAPLCDVPDDRAVNHEEGSLRDRLRAYEQRLICETFQSLDRSPKRTAAALGIDRVTLWRKLRSYGTDTSPRP